MTHEAAGWFGKVAMLGDFASRRLPPEWVQVCDGWLSAGVRTAQAELGERWLDVYLAAPLWRFAWAPRIIDERWWFGVLMPSCDAVGRYFPLIIAVPRAQAPTDRIGLDHLELWWSHVAQAAVRTLDTGATLDAFEADLGAAPPWPGAARSSAAPAPTRSGLERHGLAPGATLAEIAHRLAAAGMLQQLAGRSVWSPLRDPDQPGSVSLHAGLPPAAAFADMLRGTW